MNPEENGKNSNRETFDEPPELIPKPVFSDLATEYIISLMKSKIKEENFQCKELFEEIVPKLQSFLDSHYTLKSIINQLLDSK